MDQMVKKNDLLPILAKGKKSFFLFSHLFSNKKILLCDKAHIFHNYWTMNSVYQME